MPDFGRSPTPWGDSPFGCDLGAVTNSCQRSLSLTASGARPIRRPEERARISVGRPSPTLKLGGRRTLARLVRSADTAGQSPHYTVCGRQRRLTTFLPSSEA